ncbi:MAG: hypothetical protein KGL53_00090, partial [Elusimicrobia bacterium]|nr:hypothetical protein [Elusimicrobiota bacterium]
MAEDGFEITETANYMLAVARSEAGRRGGRPVGAGVLALGFAAVAQRLDPLHRLVPVLAGLGVDAAGLRDALERAHGAIDTSGLPPSDCCILDGMLPDEVRAIPFGPDARKVMGFAAEESRRLGHVGRSLLLLAPWHILLGLIRAGDEGILPSFPHGADLELGRAREAVREAASGREDRPVLSESPHAADGKFIYHIAWECQRGEMSLEDFLAA